MLFWSWRGVASKAPRKRVSCSWQGSVLRQAKPSPARLQSLFSTLLSKLIASACFNWDILPPILAAAALLPREAPLCPELRKPWISTLVPAVFTVVHIQQRTRQTLQHHPDQVHSHRLLSAYSSTPWTETVAVHPLRHSSIDNTLLRGNISLAQHGCRRAPSSHSQSRRRRVFLRCR